MNFDEVRPNVCGFAFDQNRRPTFSVRVTGLFRQRQTVKSRVKGTNMRVRLAKIVMTLAVCLALTAPGNAQVVGKTVTGKSNLKSINVIAFAPQGVLLVGDGAGAQVLAIQTGDVQPGQKTLAGHTAGIRGKLAESMGTTAQGIEIIDLAVNPASGLVYFAVLKQADKQYAILTLDGRGQIGLVDPSELRHARIALRAGDSKISRVTDVAWADDRVIASGRSNEEFASKIFSISAPLNHEDASAAFSAETYHVSHRRWETKAPMSVVIPFKEQGKTYVVGAFSCTPIVKYPLDALKPGSQVKGVSMIELGSGNRPLDMFVYQKGGKSYVLANTFRFHHKRRPFGPSPYWTVKFEQGLLSGSQQTNEQAVRRLKGDYQPATDRIQLVADYHGVVQMDRLGDDRAVVLRAGKQGMSLDVLALP